MGAYSIAEHIAPDPLTVIFSDVLFSSTLGFPISFSLPVAMETIPERELPKLMQGMVFGVIAAFPTLIVGGLLSILIVSLLIPREELAEDSIVRS